VSREIDAESGTVSGVTESPATEKNVRRRVYDALNVLRAAGVIEVEDDKKTIAWRAPPTPPPHPGGRNAAGRDPKANAPHTVSRARHLRAEPRDPRGCRRGLPEQFELNAMQVPHDAHRVP
jgi:hypothetical protein